MLVLTRKVGEEIVIGGDIRVTVTAIQGERVRIGVTAPGDIRVDRAEVHVRRGSISAPTPGGVKSAPAAEPQGTATGSQS